VVASLADILAGERFPADATFVRLFVCVPCSNVSSK